MILLDYRLPGGADGLDFYERLEAAGYDPPVILVTGFGNEATAIQALRVGVRDFVTKSAEYLEYLPEAVERVLRQVRTESQLAASEERFRLVVRATQDIAGDWDVTTGAVWWNDGVQTQLGYPAPETLPDLNSWSERVHPDDREQVLGSVRAVLDGTGEIWLGEYRFRRADGAYSLFSSRGYVLRNAAGRPVRMIGSMVDVTEWRRL